jgi:UDP:flavonoid glycosyltransferase YjiC (YdhE family)
VLLTQGTYNTDPRDLLAPALAGLGALDVDVVATTGRAGVVDVGVEVPANARIVDFVDFADVLPSTRVVVSNGGWGGVLDALSAGVPMVVAGSDLDKPEIAARVAWSGAGIDLRTGRPGAARVRDAVCRVLADPAFGARATHVAGKLRRLGGAEAATTALERFVDQTR